MRGFPGRSGQRAGDAPLRGRITVAVICTLIALAAFTASHIHGISDPDTHHSVVDYVIFAQAHVGFLAVVLLLVFFVCITTRWPGPAVPRLAASRPAFPNSIRSPPAAGV